MQCELNDFVCADQTHSAANFHHVTLEDKGRGATQMNTAIADTDALYTYEPNLVLCSFTADCVPVIFYNEVKGLIGVVHSGWQVTVKEITLKLFKHLTQVEQCNPSDFHIQIGAAFSQKNLKSMKMSICNLRILGMRMSLTFTMTIPISIILTIN